ncbi:hypothetical protein LP418_24150 [Nocardioides sp. B-3]|nr:hypothetical protein [Nocardioides sp. B-3]UUZ59036.1 hypothetical protein LP418_24150 [Nocardioides sp. B-3]
MWCAIVPQKALARAKSRIALLAAPRRDPAAAMLRDTVSALEVTPAIGHVFVVWDDDADMGELPETETLHPLAATGLDLNHSVELGAARARRAMPGSHVVVVPSDLPALDPTELATFLDRAGRFCRAFVPDADKDGTSVLTATGHSPLRASLRRELADAPPGLRRARACE